MLPRSRAARRHQRDDAGASSASSSKARDYGFIHVPATCEPLVLEPGRGGTLFIDAPTGVAGDMLVAALYDLGVPRQTFEAAVQALALSGVAIEFQRGMAGAIGAARFAIAESAQPPRDYAAIRRLIEMSPLPRDTRGLAQQIFRRLAEAEAQVHRVDVERVHFHEVGAVDSILDVVLVAHGLLYLGSQVVCAPLPIGNGVVECQHGTLPLPAPATLLALRGVPTYGSSVRGETVTPTGAAIVATVATRFASWPEMAPQVVGYGAGSRVLSTRPNLLRLVLGESVAESGSEALVLVQCNVDDMTGEVVAHVIEQLLQGGALDAWAEPITGKKGRPGWLLSCLGPSGDRARLSSLLLRESSSIGVRWSACGRYALPREALLVDTPYGSVRVKLSGAPGSPEFHGKPEFESCRELAQASGAPLRLVLEAARVAVFQLMQSRNAEHEMGDAEPEEGC